MIVNATTQTIELNQTLKVVEAKRGIYDIGYEFFSPDPGDYLTLTLEYGKLSLWRDEAWQPVTGSVAFQPGQMQGGDSLRLRVDSKASFAFSTVDSYSVYPYDDAPTFPSARFTLAPGLESDMGDRRSAAWKIGKVDALTGVDWTNGVVSPSESAGITINETIGGDDVSDYAKFNVTKTANVQIETSGAIAQLLNSKGMIVADSSDGYESLLTATLKRGTYYLGFSSESSTVEGFTSTLNLV